VPGDIRIAGAEAYFRAAGINNGLTASELGLSYLLPRAIGTSRAFELMLTGRDVGADEAERIGLVSRTVPDDKLLDVCYELGERIASFSRPGTELTKRTLWSGLDAASLEGHMQAEGLGQLFVRLLTGNFEEAVAARAEERAPVFTDDK
jgi:enoyl-CoA hydratase